MDLKHLWRTFVSKPESNARDESWVRRGVEKSRGSFTCRVSMFETAWNPFAPDIVGANARPFSGAAVITYTSTSNGDITAEVVREKRD